MTWPVEQPTGGRGLSVTEDAARELRPLAGRRLLGVVDCGDAIGLVFEDGGDGGNLVTVYADCCSRGDLLNGRLDFGSVMEPEWYAVD